MWVASRWSKDHVAHGSGICRQTCRDSRQGITHCEIEDRVGERNNQETLEDGAAEAENLDDVWRTMLRCLMFDLGPLGPGEAF